MSRFFFQVIFFFEAIVADIVAGAAKVCDHAFDGARAAIKIAGNLFQRAEPVLADQFQDVVEPFFIG